MPRFLSSSHPDAPYGYRSNGPKPSLPIKQNACCACKHGAKCAGACGKRVCKAHAFGCSLCVGRMCEACWTRHEVGGRHE